MWFGVIWIVLGTWLVVACCLDLDPNDKWPSNQAWSSLFGRKIANRINMAVGIASVIAGIVLMIYIASTR